MSEKVEAYLRLLDLRRRGGGQARVDAELASLAIGMTPEEARAAWQPDAAAGVEELRRFLADTERRLQSPTAKKVAA